MKKKILFLVPLPPPLAGPEIANEMLLGTQVFSMMDHIIHVKANVRDKNSSKGVMDLAGVWASGMRYLAVLRVLISPKVGVFYFLLSSSRIGFARDVLYVLTAWILRKGIVAHYRGGSFKYFYQAQPRWWQNVIKFTLSRIALLIVQGEGLKQTFEELYPVERLRVLHNGIKFGPYACQRIADPSKPFTILFVGHLWFPKGFYDLILAYKKLFKRYGSRITLIFVGERMKYLPNAMEFLRGQTKDNFMRHGEQIAKAISYFVVHADQYNAHYLGLVEGAFKIEVLKRADLFVLPSYTEGFSMACLEAMASGLPVVVTPVGVFPEIVKNGENGLITPLGDSDKLADNIELLMLDEPMRKRMGNNNKQYVKDNFDVEIIAKKLIDILENVFLKAKVL